MSRVAPRQTTGSHHVDPKVGLKMLFQMPETAQPRIRPEGWRCVGCGAHVQGTRLELPSFCVFCRAWATWRRDGDEAWTRAVNAWDDDGGRSAQPMPAGAPR